MPRGTEIPLCSCGKALRRECERDLGRCVNCDAAHALSQPTAAIGNVHPIFAGLISAHFGIQS